MRIHLLLLMTFSLVCSVAKSTEIHSVAVQQVKIENFSGEGSSCNVRFPANLMKCENTVCKIRAPRRSSLKSIELTLSCIPISAPTGFENPPPDAKVFSIQTPNSKGHVSLIDETPEEPGERMRELYFCLYNDVARLCGFSKTLILKDGESADASKDIVRIIKNIVFTSDKTKKAP
jgi:hypothetical protein